MYTAVCVLLLTGFVFLSYLHLCRPARWLTATESVLAVSGVLLFPLVFLMLSLSLRGQSADFSAWAWDSLTTYLRYALPLAGVFFFLTVCSALSALWEKKYRSPFWIHIRTLASLACSVVLLALAGFFGVLSATDTVPLQAYIQSLGIASALLLRTLYPAETLWQRKSR